MKRVWPLALTIAVIVSACGGDTSEPNPDSQFLSDYWSSEEGLRDFVEFLDGNYEEAVASGNPIIAWFLMTCTDPQDPGPGVQVFHTNATSRDQFPMAPATYPVSGGLFDANGPAGTVITNLALTLDEQFEPIPDSGTLEITRWDSSTLEGTLTFDGSEFIAEDPRMVTVTVDFEFMCEEPPNTGCG